MRGWDGGLVIKNGKLRKKANKRYEKKTKQLNDTERKSGEKLIDKFVTIYIT
jgi:hypothetical protein